MGKIKKETVVKTNVYKNCKIYCGAHDSSASYYLYEKKFNEPFTLISTGTWIVIFNKKMNLNLLSEDNEIFAKLNIYGKKIPVIRFMGGREYLKILNKKTSVNKEKNMSAAPAAEGATPGLLPHRGPSISRSAR